MIDREKKEKLLEVMRLLEQDASLENMPEELQRFIRQINPAEIAPTEPRVSAMTCRKAPFTFRLSSLYLESVIPDRRLAINPNVAMISIPRLLTSIG